MALKDKLDLFGLSDKERKIAEEKFLAPLSLVTEEEIKEIISTLSAKGITITKARELKVVGNSRNDIERNFNILDEIHETGIYKQNPNLISSNVIDINKRIKYCIQTGIPYKKEDGTYEEYVFSERAWQKRFNAESAEIVVEPVVNDFEESIVTVEPEIAKPMEEVIQFEPVREEKEETVPVIDNEHIDIEEFMKTDIDEEPKTISFSSLEDSVEKMHSELDEIDEKANSLANERKSLEQQYAKLNDYKANFASELNEQFVGFEDFEPETYGIGGRAA